MTAVADPVEDPEAAGPEADLAAVDPGTDPATVRAE